MSKFIPFSNNTIKNSFGSYYREHRGVIVPRELCNEAIVPQDLENGLSVKNNDSLCHTKQEMHRSFLPIPAYYQGDKPENINIGPIYYTTSGAGLPLAVIDLKNLDNYPYKTQVISNYIDNLITNKENKENNEISNVFFESVNTIKTLVSDVVSSTDNEKDYCDAV